MASPTLDSKEERRAGLLFLLLLFNHYVWFFVTPWTAACLPNFPWSLLKLMFIELVIPSNHLILCHSLLLLPSKLHQHQGLSQWISSSCYMVKYLGFNLNINSSNEYSGLTYFRIDWFDLIAVQGTLRSLLQYHNSKASTLWHSTSFMVQLSHLYMTTGKTIDLTIQTFVSKVISLLFNTLSRFVITFLPKS